MKCVTDLKSSLVPSFSSAHREWNLNKVGQQQTVSNKTANILDVALVKSSVSAFPVSLSLREGLHACGHVVLSSSSHAGAIFKASKMRFDDVTKVGCIGHCACKLGSSLLNATLDFFSSVQREVFMKTQAENHAH